MSKTKLDRPLWLGSCVLGACASLMTAWVSPAAMGQVADGDTTVKEVENSKFSTRGLIVSNAVYIRCGPGDNYYPTIKLDKGAKVQVVGAKFDWLKIVPPEGSFCYVAKLYVDRHGDGKVGRVNKDSINVRAGSALSALKIGILCELNQNEEVEIIGEEQEYFKIKPPEGKAFLYVNKKFVEPDPEAKPEVQVAKTDTPKTDVAKTDAPKTDVAKTDAPKTDTPKTDVPKTEVAKTDPSKPDVTKTDGPATDPIKTDTPKTEVAKTDSTKPEMKPEGTGSETPKTDLPGNETPKTDAGKTDAGKTDVAKTDAAKTDTAKTDTAKPETIETPESAEVLFDKAETAFNAAKVKPLDQQPIATLLPQFELLAKSDKLPESMRRVAEARVYTLKARSTAQAELAKLHSNDDQRKQQRLALEAEQAELQKRIAETAVKVYTAVGTLQPSSLQQGQGTLYRVTDPATGRTVCYLRSSDSKTLSLIGQFVGVKGALQEEARLGARVITPTEIVACDPGKVHQTITAQIIPPSLVPKEPATATIEPQPQ